MERRETTIHGRKIAYRVAGDAGPPLVLVHGITQDASTWEPISEPLAAGARLIAPDLPGHGDSDLPAGDHSLGSYASTIRDLLFAIEEPHVTLVGHSLGGGVALQFAYQFPEMLARLVLMDSGGLGRHVSPVLRAAALPGAGAFLGVLSSQPVRRTVDATARALDRAGVTFGTDLAEGWAGVSGMHDRDARRAFLATVKAVIALGGQRVSARDKLYLAEHVPTLILWGRRDRIIPLHHGRAAHDAIPGSRLEVVEDAGHFPHHEHPEQVARTITTFVAETEAADVPREEWGAILREGVPGTTSD